ncbi:MAG: O-antigen ligase family protein [Desulfobacterium sp.]
MKKISFFVLCVLVVIPPMLRGSVHLWAETLIQMLVLTGGVMVVLGRYVFVDKKAYVNLSGPGKMPGQAAIESRRNNRKAVQSSPRRKKQNVWMAVLPLGLLVAISTLFSPHKSLAMEGLVSLLVCLVIFYIARHTLCLRKEQRWMVYVIIGMGLFLSFFGMLKLFNMGIPGLWEYAEILRPGSTSLSGPYVNRNHMAGFLDMVIPMMLGLFLTRERSPEMRLGMICLVLFLIVTQAMTLSRGGWTATVGAMIFMMMVLMFRKDFYNKRLLLFIVVGIVVVGTLLLASTPVVQRINTLIENDAADNLEGRMRMWKGTRQMIADHLLTGTGPGTFTEAYPAYQEPGAAVLAAYAHNDYLQFMADCGVLVIPVMAWLLFLFFRAGFTQMNNRSRQIRGITLGVMGAVVAILIHSFSDFNLHTPANAVLFTVLFAMVGGRSH